MHDEAVGSDGRVRSILRVQRDGGPTDGWRCAGVDPAGTACLRPLVACALESDLRRPYFRGTHIDGCSKRSPRSDDLPGDRGRVRRQGPRASKWRLRLDDVPETGPSGRRRPDDHEDGTRTRRTRSDATLAPTPRADPHTLAGFLDAAVHGTLPAEAALPDGPWLPADVLVVPAADATAARFDDDRRILWGRIDAVRHAARGGTMLLLASGGDRIGVLIPRELRGYFTLAVDREFIGRHVMTYGFRTGERPYVKVPSPRGVVFDPPVRVRAVPLTE